MAYARITKKYFMCTCVLAVSKRLQSKMAKEINLYGNMNNRRTGAPVSALITASLRKVQCEPVSIKNRTLTICAFRQTIVYAENQTLNWKRRQREQPLAQIVNTDNFAKLKSQSVLIYFRAKWLNKGNKVENEGMGVLELAIVSIWAMSTKTLD